MKNVPATEVADERLKPTVHLRGQEAEYSVHEGGQLAAGLPAATSVAGTSLQVLARPATPADSEAIHALERECLSPPWTRLTIENLLKDTKYFCIVATINDEIIGHAIAWNVGDEGEIDRLAVANDWRRRGIGARLLDELLSIAQSRGVRELFLEVRENNVAAQQLYRGRGFEIVGARRDYYPDGSTALVMKREWSCASDRKT